jgi:hypothetical protein
VARQQSAAHREEHNVTQYLLAIHSVEGQAQAPMNEQEMRNLTDRVYALEAEMKEAGAWLFAGRLHEAGEATVTRSKGGKAVTTDGPYAETKEHLGGFYVVEADSLQDAQGWAARTSELMGAPIEVRTFWDLRGPE